MEFGPLVDLIGGVGFPIAVSAYLLVRFDRLIARVIVTLEKLVERLDR